MPSFIRPNTANGIQRIHDAILAVGHKPDETDGLILSIGAQVDDETVKSLPLAS